MGCIIGAMFVLTLIVCIKTRVAQRKQKRFGDHREHVSINVRPIEERAEENNYTENDESETNDHENYAMVKPTEKCYVDLQAGEYDLLRSQRKHVQRPAEAKGEPCYDHFIKPNSLYDITGESERNEVFHPDYEYEVVNNIKKNKSNCKNLKALDPVVAPNIKRNTGYENTKSRNPRECVTLANSQNGLRVKSTLM